MGWLLERTILSERLNWRILPHEMEEMDPSDIKWPLYLLRVFRAAQVLGTDLERATEEMMEIQQHIEDLRSQQDDD